MLHRHLAGELPQILEHFNENHLAQVLFRGALWSVGARDFRDQRIQVANQRPRRLFIVAQRAGNQLASVDVISHAFHNVSTPLNVTVRGATRLQEKSCNQFGNRVVTHQQGITARELTKKQTMKRKLIAITVGAALSLGGLSAIAHPEHGGPGGAGGHQHGDWGNPLEHLTKELNLTPDQQAKVTPIVDQAKPQIQQIHQEAMEKMRAVMESTGAQIRPLLSPEQQQKFDAMKKAHEDMHNAMKEMHEAKSQTP